MRFPGAPGRPDAKAADAIISRAVEQGINYLDTAYLYPGNEACVGASLERLGLRDQVLLATKLPHASCKCAEDFDRFFDEQLRQPADRPYRLLPYAQHYLAAQWERVVALNRGLDCAPKGFGAHSPDQDFVPRQRSGLSDDARCI